VVHGLPRAGVDAPRLVVDGGWRHFMSRSGVVTEPIATPDSSIFMPAGQHR
jgi:hypothetical protein